MNVKTKDDKVLQWISFFYIGGPWFELGMDSSCLKEHHDFTY